MHGFGRAAKSVAKNSPPPRCPKRSSRRSMPEKSANLLRQG